MTKEELNNLYQDLSEEEQTIRTQLKQVEQPGPEGDGPHPKRPDYGDVDDEDAYAHEVADMGRNLAMEQELKARLQEVLKAKERISSGQYGKCEVCSNNIQEERLKAIPIASLCMDCASKKH